MLTFGGQPERISGGKYTMRSDVWSMGISLLELVKNRFPFSFPADAPAFEVVLTISKGQVGLFTFSYTSTVFTDLFLAT